MVTQAVPANIIVPFVGVSFDGSLAGGASTTVPVHVLCIGQRLSTGIKLEGEIYTASTADEVAVNSGWGSMLHRMALYIFKTNRTVPVSFVALDDADGSSAAEYEWTVGGTATEVGEYVTYIAGQRYAVGVAVGDTGTEVQTALTALLTADTNKLPVTASDAIGVMTLTCKQKGIAAGDLDVRFHANRGEKLPAGLTINTVTVTAGTVDPDIQDALDVLGSNWYNIIVNPYVDNTNMNALEVYLESVYDPMVSRDAMSYQAKRATLSEMITYGDDIANRNCRFVTVLPAYKRMQSTFEIAANVAGATAVSIQDDPAVPLHRMTCTGLTVLASEDKWTVTELNQLASAGIATLLDEIGVQTHSTVTMYRQNEAGGVDTAYQFQNTLFILSAARYRFRNQMLTKYPRAKLGDAADNLRPGQQIMTPAIAAVEAISWFKDAQYDGLFDPSDTALSQFKAELIVERDPNNVNRMNWILPPDLMNQFIIGSAVIQFRL